MSNIIIKNKKHELTQKEYNAINTALVPLGFCLFIDPLRIEYFHKDELKYLSVSDKNQSKKFKKDSK